MLVHAEKIKIVVYMDAYLLLRNFHIKQGNSKASE